MKRSLLLLQVLCLLFLCACTSSAESELSTAPQDSHTVPSATSPSKTELPRQDILAVRIAPEDRCLMTSNGRMAETEAGFYMFRNGYLFYADKTDLSNWVLVCNRPECAHERTSCPGYINNFWMTEDSIYYLTDVLDGERLERDALVRMSPDGSSREIVHSAPDMNTTGTAWSGEVVADTFYNCLARLQEDGTLDCNVVRVDSSGAEVLFSSNYPEVENQLATFARPMAISYSIRGDMTIMSGIPLDGTTEENKDGWDKRPFNRYYQINGDSIRALNLSDSCSLYGSYISGDALYHYHVNDGFYLMDLATGEEAKIADAAYENAFGHCIDGQLMIECTMSVPGTASNAETLQMRYFDGTEWHEVALPETWDMTHMFRMFACASDRIFFTVIEDYSLRDQQEQLGYIMLGEDTLTICDQYAHYFSPN